MKTLFFSAKQYDKNSFTDQNKTHNFQLEFVEEPLNRHTAVLAKGFDAICIFVNDSANAEVLDVLAEQGVKLIALRSAGYNHVDLSKAKELGIKVVRVPAYSPYSVAEHTVALILTINRKTHRAYNRVREGNFSLNGLMGFDLHGKTVGLIGLGKIGVCTAKILLGFGCKVLGYDVEEQEEVKQLGVEYSSLDNLYLKSDIISLHCPLTPDTHHIIDSSSIAKMKKGVMLINTSRGALVDTQAVIDGLKSEYIKYLGIDVYEEEADLFFEDLSDKVIKDDVFMRLLSFNNVLITGHQAFFTEEAMREISRVTLGNIASFERGGEVENEVV
ncbi:2-hydroxyacid dehydrogenase [Antarcticibacterium flavum]|uniref:2-hydroxyacid dehydrogenase n=1 Tax=Antarcticibacterium flavum TaxID=2058175 RepID=A0A5B7X1C4_9FLAO|nr:MULTISPECIES: 2-hydroxyacid dehydrogenase [Antarcticibacterium]MCM4159927.1 hydroxyacid dehydrogenase [Antarcticibacterium sp. W02-3]QCY68925.1 2-hydroxyacid dehydrogenase [Antarcticibacterium flavum]